MSKPLKLLLLFADTGGGHRAASQALAEGLRFRYGDAVDPVLFDGLRAYAPFPVSHLDDMYPWMSGMSKTWGDGWTTLNDPDVARRFMRGCAVLSKLTESDYIVGYVEHGKAEGTCFLVMDYVEAENLKELYETPALLSAVNSGRRSRFYWI